MMTGMALRAPALEIAGRIAGRSGARLLAQGSNARIERGAGELINHWIGGLSSRESVRP